MGYAIIDLSSTTVRAVAVQGGRVAAWSEGSLPAAAMLGGLLADQTALTETVRQTLASLGVPVKSAALVLPASICLDRVLDLPPVSRRHVPRLAAAEAGRALALDPAAVRLYWREVSRGPRLSLYLLAVLREAYDTFRALFAALGLRPRGMFVITHCLARAAALPSCHVAHLGDDGQLTYATLEQGVPVVGAATYLNQGDNPAAAIVQAVRAAARHGGGMGPAPVVVSGAGAAATVAELNRRGFSAQVPAFPGLPDGLDPARFGPCLGALADRDCWPVNLLRSPERQAWRLEARLALVLAACCAALVVGTRGLSQEVLYPWLAAAQADLAAARAEATAHAPLQALVAEHQALADHSARLEQQLAAIPPRGPDWPALIVRLQDDAGASGVTVRTVTPGPDGLFTLVGRAPGRRELNDFASRLEAAPLSGPRVAKYADMGSGVEFTITVVGAEGRT